MKRIFLLNAHSGRRRSGNKLTQLEQYFRDRPGGFELLTPKSRDETLENIFQIAQETLDPQRPEWQIVVLGGDGTINAVLNGALLAGPAALRRLCFVTTDWGTGCDLHRAIGGTADWVSVVENFNVKNLDVGKIVYQTTSYASFFLNCASVGLSSDVVLRQKKLPTWCPALLSYVIPLLETLFTYRAAHMEIALDGERHAGKFINGFFVKGRTIGGGMRLGGAVDFNDGKFDVTLVPKLSAAECLRHLPRIFSGDFSHPTFTKKTTRQIEIRAEKAQPVELDGEVIGNTDITISILPEPMRFCFPA